MAESPNAQDVKKEQTLHELTSILNGISSTFTWKTEYDDKIEKAAADNLVQDWDWKIMRDAIKRRLHQVITTYLTMQQPKAKRDGSSGLSSETTLVDLGRPNDPPLGPTLAISPAAIEQRPSTPHGVIIAPFPRRPVDDKVMPSKLSVESANEEMERLFGMLDEFEEYPPFTIQRICELLVRPRVYKSLGKFIRAFERGLLVTSTYDQYVIDTYAVQSAPGQENFSESALKLAMTPLFSPIPFLHPELDPVTGQPITTNGSSSPRRSTAADAPSPMMLNDDIPPPSPRLGLVDELDDPSADSNRMADHPQAINSSTPIRSSSRVVDIDDMDMDEADLFGSTMFSSSGAGNTSFSVSSPSPLTGVGSLSDRF
ncbi:hypothetical protein FRB99_001849, partial [Tulasnella sp. 403]